MISTIKIYNCKRYTDKEKKTENKRVSLCFFNELCFVGLMSNGIILLKCNMEAKNYYY